MWNATHEGKAHTPPCQDTENGDGLRTLDPRDEAGLDTDIVEEGDRMDRIGMVDEEDEKHKKEGRRSGAA